MLTFIVSGQDLSRVDGKGVATLSQKYLKCRFVFSDDWDNVDTKTAIFYDSTGKNSYKVLLENDNTCIADSRALKDGSFTVTVYGTKENDTEFVVTTNKVLVKMNASGFTLNSTNTEVNNPDLIEQVVIKYLNDHAGGAFTQDDLQEAVNNYLEKNPVEGAGDKNVQPDWNQTDSTKDDFIKNKPTTLDGKDGKDGADGVSPTVEVVSTNTGHIVKITDKNGVKSFEVSNGANGTGSGSVTDEQIRTAVDNYFADNPIQEGEALTDEEINQLFDEAYGVLP